MAVAVLAACTGTSGVTTTSATAPTTTRAQPVTGTIGGDVTFAGLVLTVVPPVADPAPADQAKAQPDPGTRYVQVTVKARNPSPVGLSFTPAAQAVLVDDTGASTRPTPGLYPSDLAGADVPPGGEKQGTLSFVLAAGHKPVTLVFTDLAGVMTTVVL